MGQQLRPPPNKADRDTKRVFDDVYKHLNSHAASITNVTSFFMGTGGSGGAIINAGVVPATPIGHEGVRTFVTDIVFTATDYRTVTWTAGTIRTSTNDTYAIATGTTGNMAATTYIYFDPLYDDDALRVGTEFGNIKAPAFLLCWAKNTANNGQYAVCIPVVGLLGINETVIGPNSISTGKVQALAITTDLLAASAVTAEKISVASLSAIVTETGTLAIGTSGYLRGGQSDYNTGEGFWMGYSSSAYKFSIGNPAGNYLTWDGSTLTISGSVTITGGSTDLDDIADGSTYKRTTANEKTGAGRAYSAIDTSNLLATGAVPATAANPTASGLYLGSDYMGYWKTGTPGSWKTFMDNGGNFYLGGTSGTLQWDGSTLTISSTSGSNTTSISSGATAFQCGSTSSPNVIITRAGSFQLVGSGTCTLSADGGLSFNDTDSPPTITDIGALGLEGSYGSPPVTSWSIVTTTGTATFVAVNVGAYAVWHAGNFDDNHSDWDEAHGWGDHAGLYLLVSSAGDIYTHDASEFAVAAHNHSGTYLPVSGAGDIYTHNASEFAAASHNHAASAINSGTISDTYIASATTWNALVTFPGFGTSHATAAYGDHTHDYSGVFAPITEDPYTGTVGVTDYLGSPLTLTFANGLLQTG